MLEAKEHIIAYFPDSPLVLEYVPDPEVDNYVLALYISTDFESEEAMDKLDQLYKDRWVDVSIQSQGKLCINVE